jgi:hypothetical protein
MNVNVKNITLQVKIDEAGMIRAALRVGVLQWQERQPKAGVPTRFVWIVRVGTAP